MKRFLTAAIVLLCSLLFAGAESAPPEPVKESLDTFFAALKDKEIDRAFDQLVKSSPIAEKAEDMALLKTKTRQAIEMFGRISGGELIETKMVGTHLLRTTALSLGSLYPLRWRFYFYRVEETWRLIDIQVDDRLGSMFDEPDNKPARE
jgi:hypothetical protein